MSHHVDNSRLIYAHLFLLIKLIKHFIHLIKDRIELFIFSFVLAFFWLKIPQSVRQVHVPGAQFVNSKIPISILSLNKRKFMESRFVKH